MVRKRITTISDSAAVKRVSEYLLILSLLIVIEPLDLKRLKLKILFL